MEGNINVLYNRKILICGIPLLIKLKSSHCFSTINLPTNGWDIAICCLMVSQQGEECVPGQTSIYGNSNMHSPLRMQLIPLYYLWCCLLKFNMSKRNNIKRLNLLSNRNYSPDQSNFLSVNTSNIGKAVLHRAQDSLVLAGPTETPVLCGNYDLNFLGQTT